MSDDENDSSVYEEEYKQAPSTITVDLPGKKVDLPVHIIK